MRVFLCYAFLVLEDVVGLVAVFLVSGAARVLG